MGKLHASKYPKCHDESEGDIFIANRVSLASDSKNHERVIPSTFSKYMSDRPRDIPPLSVNDVRCPACAMALCYALRCRTYVRRKLSWPAAPADARGTLFPSAVFRRLARTEPNTTSRRRACCWRLVSVCGVIFNQQAKHPLCTCSHSACVHLFKLHTLLYFILISQKITRPLPEQCRRLLEE